MCVSRSARRVLRCYPPASPPTDSFPPHAHIPAEGVKNLTDVVTFMASLMFVAPSSVDRGLLYTAALGEGTFVRALSAGGDDTRRVMVDHARRPRETRVLESVEAGHTSHAVAAQVCADLDVTLPPIRVDGQCKYGLLSQGKVRCHTRARLCRSVLFRVPVTCGWMTG